MVIWVAFTDQSSYFFFTFSSEYYYSGLGLWSDKIKTPEDQSETLRIRMQSKIIP